MSLKKTHLLRILHDAFTGAVGEAGGDAVTFFELVGAADDCAGFF